ncbi:MAG: hypothetical protein H6581_03470 [Bacteroidia bacterium]|nr:hypothetical protein [Bacteroidia bacterium]
MKRKPLFFSLPIFIFLTFTGINSRAQTLSQRLWKMIEPCKNEVESEEEFDAQGKSDYGHFIDDAKNGYVHVEGGWPTCGCECSSTAAAFKNAKGEYALLARERWNCSWTHKISADKPVSSLLPEGFGAASFIPDYKNEGRESESIFYLDVEIPQFGTDTRVSIHLIPFGLGMKNDKILGLEYSEEGASNRRALGQISYLARNMESELTPKNIIEGNKAAIPAHDQKIIENMIGEGHGKFQNLSQLQTELLKLSRAYELYCLIKHSTITLGWDVQKGRFFVKSAGDPPAKMDFITFLKEGIYWDMVC